MDESAVHAIALAAAAERSVEGCLKQTVEGLARQDGVAGACIWLLAPDDSCPVCSKKSESERDARLSLHLVASAGSSLDGEGGTELKGQLHRLTAGEGLVGSVAASRGSALLTDTDGTKRGWELLRRARIKSFAVSQIESQGNLTGVVAVFSRDAIDPRGTERLRELARQVGIAIVKSRAFAESEARAAELSEQNAYLREEIAQAAGPAGIIGRSEPLQRALRQAELVADGTSPVLICGESGTGKELFARFIHEHSPRRDRPLIKVNCGSIPHELFESEFFGHVKGSFTGAVRDRIGRFGLADKGTLFLDEVGEIPLELQPKLLRALQEGEFERVGEERTTQVDVRVICATNRELAAEVAGHRFREDLYYRLAVFPLSLPPLRQRGDDIVLLAEHFAAGARRRANRPDFRLTDADMEALRRYPWPGNVRELSSVIERAAILSPEGKHADVAALLATPVSPALAEASPAPPPKPSRVVRDREWRKMERENLIAALEKANWKVSGAGGAAELLGMNASTLSSRMRALGLRRPARAPAENA